MFDLEQAKKDLKKTLEEEMSKSPGQDPGAVLSMLVVWYACFGAEDSQLVSIGEQKLTAPQFTAVVEALQQEYY